MMFLCAFITAVAVGAVTSTTIRDIGGEFTTIDKHPSLVQVEFHNDMVWTQACSGTIITDRHVISAAQCFDGFLFNTRDRRIRAGSSSRNAGGLVVKVSNRINHPSYVRNRYDGDISIVELESALTFNEDVQSTMIVRQGFELFPNIPVNHVGWGSIRLGGGGEQAPQLRHVQVTVINHHTCVERYKPLDIGVTSNMICSGALDVGGRDACEGDEGGPLYFNKDILVGVVSWGHRCADPAWPRVNTKVSAYSNWIMEIIPGLKTIV